MESTSLIRNPLVVLVAGVVLGLVLGLVVGWVLVPVQWENVQANQLGSPYKEYYLRAVANDWARSADTDRARLLVGNHAQDLKDYVEKANTAPDLTPDDKRNISNMLDKVIEKDKLVEAGGGGTAGPNILTYLGYCLAGLILVAVVGGAAFYYMSRRAAGAGEPMSAAQEAAAAAAAQAAQMPQEQWGGRAAPPVAQFTSKYVGTDVGYNDSFSIDTQAGDFLGECGVGVSELIGTGDPKKITALEVWLFDKNDIRTVTKVLMSEHAFYDDALRAKLAPKGEAILARVGEVVLLETASLEVSARVIDLEYGSGQSLPANSYFSKVTIELSAWPKEVIVTPG